MILNIYKPKQWTSFDIVAKLRGILRTKKIGHAGTLDPLAEGVLVVLTEKDTKRQDEFMHQKKEYVAEVAFGATSASYDLEQPLEITNTTPDLDDLKQRLSKVLPDFIGDTQQQVPVYSAVKVGGKPLYKKARKGDTSEIVLPVKNITIFNIEILDSYYKEYPLSEATTIKLPVFKLRVECSSGTYIRSLAYDLGEKLKVGGVMASLLRTKVGDFCVEDSKQLSEVSLSQV